MHILQVSSYLLVIFLVCANGLSNGEIGALHDLQSSWRVNQWTGAPSCSWDGVECGNDSHVQNLTLFSFGLDGTIPSSIAEFTELENLDLLANSFTGDIPSAIGNLTNLKTLYLGANQLTGTIPDTIGNLTNLRVLDLGGNHLTGTIPVTLGNLFGIETLDLATNNLTGSIPTPLCKVPICEMSNNTFTCTFCDFCCGYKCKCK